MNHPEVYAWLDNSNGGSKPSLRLTSEQPAHITKWYTRGNVNLQIINGDLLQILHKIDNKTSPLKNTNLSTIVADLIVILSMHGKWT